MSWDVSARSTGAGTGHLAVFGVMGNSLSIVLHAVSQSSENLKQSKQSMVVVSLLVMSISGERWVSMKDKMATTEPCSCTLLVVGYRVSVTNLSGCLPIHFLK